MNQTEMKNTLQDINTGVDKAEDHIKDLEEKEAEDTQSKQQKENRIQSSLWDNFKHTNIGIMGVSEVEERQQGIKNLCKKIMMKHFPNLVKQIHIQLQEANRVPNRMNSKRQTHNNLNAKD